MGMWWVVCGGWWVRWDLFQSYVQEAVREARQHKAFNLDLQFFGEPP